MKRLYVTVMIPVYNNESVLEKTLVSLEKQTYPISEVILIDDCSTDNSSEIIHAFEKKIKLKTKLVIHRKNRGLSYSYNEIIKQMKTDYLITLNADCVIVEKTAIRKLLKPFMEDSSIVETCAAMLNPKSEWRNYNFWQKCLMARLNGKVQSGRNSSFCAFKTAALKQIGLFDDTTFRTGGEDADILIRLQKIGKIKDVDTLILHLHNQDPKFSLKNLILKEAQRSEIVGAVLSKKFDWNLQNNLRIFGRIILIGGLIIPGLRILSIIFIGMFSFFYTQKVYMTEYKDLRIFILPFINIYLLFSNTFYFLRGWLTRKQRL